MVGVANSFGPGGMVAQLAKARQQAHTDEEKAVIRTFVTNYAMRDATSHVIPATSSLLKRGFSDEEGQLPGQDELGHSGRRVRLLFEIFPWKLQQSYGGDLGTFVLNEDEKLPSAR